MFVPKGLMVIMVMYVRAPGFGDNINKDFLKSPIFWVFLPQILTLKDRGGGGQNLPPPSSFFPVIFFTKS